MTRFADSSLDPAGPVAREIGRLWWGMLALGVVAFTVFLVVLIGGLARRGRATGEDADDERPNRLIVLGGVVLPAVLLSVVMVHTIETMLDIPEEGGPDAVRIEVIGHRWWWEIRYPGHDVVTANEVHLPAGRPVEFRLASADVIHSFWIPALGGKRDLIPGQVNTLVLQADRPGVHRSQCAEFCGLQHANMGFIAVVETAEDFEAWLAHQRGPAAEPASALAVDGRGAFLGARCASCHTIRGTAAAGTDGPDLTHLASRSTLAAATLPNTPEHLASWVADPHRSKPGVEMPPADLGDKELQAVLRYLEGLR